MENRLDRIELDWREVRRDVHALRWALHQSPELGYQEFNTTESLRRFLSAHGVECRTFTGATGAVALIDRKLPVTVGLRVDIDALPIQEATGIDKCSRNSGIMHACGHDMHAGIGAGVAVMAARLQELLPVNVKVIFQPAEECSPRGGALDMIERNVLKAPAVTLMLGLHVWPDYEVGEAGVRAGAIMAASDKFRIAISGVSSHAAQPYKGVDAILIAAEVLNAIYTMLPRQMDPFNPYVLTIGEINSGGRYNIVCDHVEMTGTLRTFAAPTREYIHGWLEQKVAAAASLHGGKGELILERGYGVVNNDAALAALFSVHASAVLGEKGVKPENNPAPIAEDFSAFSAAVPSLYFHLGCGCPHPLHSDQFLPKAETLDIGVKLVTSLLLSPQLAGYARALPAT